MYECPNCGGNLRYDIPSKMMACASCDSKFDPYEVSERNGAQETEDEYEVTVFKCPQCGGEIYSTDNTAAGFAPSADRQRYWRAVFVRSTGRSISYRFVRRRSSVRSLT